MIFTPNEKIILYRKKYKITQKDLCQGVCNVSTLCAIEKGKSKVLAKTGEKIIHRFNEIFEEKKIDERLDLKWLMESVDTQISRKVDKFILNLYTRKTFTYCSKFYNIYEIIISHFVFIKFILNIILLIYLQWLRYSFFVRL